MSVKILVVEDESIVAMDIKHRLEIMNYNVPAVVSSGEMAIEEAEKHKPDLILMDIVLKGDVDGIEAYQQIKKIHDIPVVYLTAYSDEKTLNRAKTTTPYGYIIKPFEDRELKCAIEVALYKHIVEKKLKRNEEKYRYLFEESTDAIFIADEDFKIQVFNPSMLELFGFNKEEMKNKSFFSLFADSNELVTFKSKIKETNHLKNYEIKFLDKEKNEKICKGNISLRKILDEELASYYGILHNTTN